MANDAFPHAPFSEREAWLWLIENAAYKDTQHYIGNQCLRVERGGQYQTLRGLGKEWSWGKNKVQGFLNKLKNGDMIRYSTGTGKTLIHIVNYDKYQTTLGTETGQRGDSAGTLKKERKERKEDNPPIVPPEESSVKFSTDFYEPEWFEWAHTELGITYERINDEYQLFTDYYTTGKGKSQRSKQENWKLRWRNWVRKCRPAKSAKGTDQYREFLAGWAQAASEPGPDGDVS